MKKYRILSLALALLLTVGLLAGCSSDDDDDDDTAGDLEGEVVIGILAPLTGSVAEYGTAVRNGAQLYIEQYNAQGGLQIKALEYDEEGEATNAITGYNSLVDQGVTAIIGDVTTTPTLAVVPLAYEDNMPMITASATAEAVTYDEDEDLLYSNMFRSCFIDPFQGEKMAAFAVEELGAETAAILYTNEDDYSIGLKEAFEEEAERQGLEVLTVESFSVGAVDFNSQLANIAAQDPDVLFVPYYYTEAALIAPQAANAGLDAIMLGCDGWDTVMNIITEPETIEGAYYCSGYSPQDQTPAVQQFLEDYEAEYGTQPGMFEAQGYDAAMILIAAIEKAVDDGLEPGEDDFRTAVIEYMAATDIDCVTGHVTFDEYNNPQKTAVIINIEDGEAAYWGNY